MCGIAGFYGKSSTTLLQPSLDRMAQALAHRGPDGEVIEIYDHVGFVHRRLSIIDLAAGKQPLGDPYGRRLIVNGEIYNYMELKQQFSPDIFRTGSDCEVILPLYHRDGMAFLDQLRGMYGLALYDPTTQDLIIACDLFSMKQVYYAETSQGFLFASEPQALLATGLMPRDVNREARTEALQLRYNTGSSTLFSSIHRLRPGEQLTVKKGEIVARHRRSKSSFAPMNTSLSTSEKLTLFQTALDDSVRLHLRADVPYGLFLSGGLDSACLLSRMTRHSAQPLKTYTIGFDTGSQKDERQQAARLSALFQTDHREIMFGQQDFWSLLPAVVAAQDDLVFDQAMIPTYRLAAVAAQDVKVVLCGEGGDETLAGYRRYQRAFWPRWLGGRISRQKGAFDNTSFKRQLAGWREDLDHLSRENAHLPLTRLQHAQWNDFDTWLPNNLLLKLDRCLMAHGLEGRTPFVDQNLFNTLFFLSDRDKVRRGQGKWLMREWLAQHLPQAMPWTKKQGFTVPVEAWMRTKGPRLAGLVAQQPGIAEFLPAAGVYDLFTKDKKGNAFVAWMLLVYALWHQHHILQLPVLKDTLATLAQR